VAASAEADRHLVLLHGIYGRGRNWRTIATAVTKARPEYACWLIDLPHHGDSPPGRHGDTVRGLAADVLEWLATGSLAPTAVLGHSYGGKVALAMADALRDHPLQVWVIDSTPESKAPSGTAWKMLQVVRALPASFATREEAVDAIVRHGYDAGVAQWMSTNLERGPHGYTWRLDFDAMQRLLDDFFATDLWHVIEQPAPHAIHVLKASESSAISDAAVRRLEAAAGDRVQLHVRQGGHWIHAEAPDVVTALLLEWLP
jgi:pimeloyl-ACP methyl ester carboxylesterase